MSAGAYYDVIEQLKELCHADIQTLQLQETTWLFTGNVTGLRFESVVRVDAPDRDRIIADLVDNAMEIEFKVQSHFVASIVAERRGDSLALDLITVEAD